MQDNTTAVPGGPRVADGHALVASTTGVTTSGSQGQPQKPRYSAAEVAAYFRRREEEEVHHSDWGV